MHDPDPSAAADRQRAATEKWRQYSGPSTGPELTGGRPAATLAGDYDFSVGEVIGEAWQRTSGLKGPFWLAALIVLVAVIALTQVVSLVVTSVFGTAEPTLAVQIAVDLVFTAIIYPFMAGFLMLGVRRAVDLPVDFKIPFSYLGAALPVVIAAILTTLMMALGFLLLVLPGVYLAVGYLFALPLIIDKGLGPWEAMEVSRTTVTRHWFKFFCVLLLLVLLYLVSALTIIGVIWTYPMMIAAIGVLYRETFGVEGIADTHPGAATASASVPVDVRRSQF